MQKEESVVFDAYILKGILGVKPYDEVYSKMKREKNHALVVSEEIMEKYSKAIAKNNYCPRSAHAIIQLAFEKLKIMQKLRWADRRIKEMKENDVKVEIEDKDDIPFVKAAFAMKARYIVTQDRRHFLSKKSEFRNPEEYVKDS